MIDEQEFLQEEPEFDRKEFTITDGQTPLRLDLFLSEKLAQVSRNKIQNSIIAELITVNGRPVKSNYKIRPKDQIEIVFPKSTVPDHVIPQDIPLDIIYEDDDLMVINKPAGMVVHPAPGNYEGTLANALAYYLKKGTQKLDNERLGLVHRIDKETSGLLLVAKSDLAATHLSSQFYHHTIQREYWALVWGTPAENSGTITGNVGRDPKNRQRMTIFEDPEMGKHAVTHYEIIESFYYTSLLKCKLETGRTHQIRIHMKHFRHPLFNDERYDGDRIHKGTIFTKYKQFVQNCFKMLPRFALHARSLGFIHPTTNKKMFFEVDPPNDFLELVDKWRKYMETKKEEDN
ncbi:MAG: RluA family pseudouridine synthase [Saprospiraceae bacterium]|nr:RluA family pseudouridine synthase [Saprospiraceae bacterium]